MRNLPGFLLGLCRSSTRSLLLRQRALLLNRLSSGLALHGRPTTGTCARQAHVELGKGLVAREDGAVVTQVLVQGGDKLDLVVVIISSDNKIWLALGLGCDGARARQRINILL